MCLVGGQATELLGWGEACGWVMNNCRLPVTGSSTEQRGPWEAAVEGAPSDRPGNEHLTCDTQNTAAPVHLKKLSPNSAQSCVTFVFLKLF